MSKMDDTMIFINELLENYLIYIQEVKRGGIPSPSAAYELIYGKLPPGNRGGRYPGSHGTKRWNGIQVDEHLEDKWLNDLKNINTIEMRASCEGHGKEWVTYIAFRIHPKHDQDGLYHSKIKEALNVGNTKCGVSLGNSERVRFIVAAKLWYGQPGWKEWWSSLASKIKRAVKR